MIGTNVGKGIELMMLDGERHKELDMDMSASRGSASPASRRSGGSTPDEVDFASATQLLGLGLGSGESRPVDELIRHLRHVAALEWIDRALEQARLVPVGRSRSMLVDGQATLEQLKNIKDQSKRLLKKAEDPTERLAALAGYFLSIAAAIVHHRTMTTDRPFRDLHDVLADLAVDAPEPWKDMLGHSIVQLESMPGWVKN